jgi:hypothetical protein
MAHLPIDSDFLALGANWPPAGSDEPAHGHQPDQGPKWQLSRILIERYNGRDRELQCDARL